MKTGNRSFGEEEMGKRRRKKYFFIKLKNPGFLNFKYYNWRSPAWLAC
jgi:hypothetical protein